VCDLFLQKLVQPTVTPIEKAEYDTVHCCRFTEYIYNHIRNKAFDSPLRPVTAFVGDVTEAVYGAVAEIRPYSTHGCGTMTRFYCLIRIG